MKKNAWDAFYENAVRKVLQPSRRVLDVGGGLRVDRERSNVELPGNAWIKPLLAQVKYVVMDVVEKYHPDIVGDVMQMPFGPEEWDAVICLAVLEHVPRPWDAMREIHRVLKPGGQAFIYVPFLYPYHAMAGYYGDYFRYTREGIEALCRPFQHVEITPVRGPIETVANLLPGSRSFLKRLARWLDGHYRGSGNQVSGFFVLATK